jgi:hypothetical protein
MDDGLSGKRLSERLPRRMDAPLSPFLKTGRCASGALTVAIPSKPNIFLEVDRNLYENLNINQQILFREYTHRTD